MQVFFVFYDCFADLWHISVNKYTPHQFFRFFLSRNSLLLTFPLMHLIDFKLFVFLAEQLYLEICFS